jgi:RND superfamily putative drug exporter
MPLISAITAARIRSRLLGRSAANELTPLTKAYTSDLVYIVNFSDGRQLLAGSAQQRKEQAMFTWWGRAVVAARWPIFAAALAVTIVGAAWGTGVFSRLVGGGFTDPGSLSATAEARITATFGNQDPDLLVLYSSKTATVNQPAFRNPVSVTVSSLRHHAGVASVASYYGTDSPTLVSTDKHATYVIVRLSATDDSGKLSQYASLRSALNAPGVTTQVGGVVAVESDAAAITKKDVTRGELIAFPLVLILLILLFGSVTAAAMPLLVGGLAVLGAFAATRLISTFTDVSTFAVNSITLLGLGMGVDYSLLIVSRFREEMHAGHDARTAVARTMASAGRTVFVSALTVAFAVASLLIYPEVFLRSMGLGGVAAVLVAMLAALSVLPAMLLVLGPRIDSLRLPLPWLRRGVAPPAPAGQGAWARLARTVMRRPVRYVVLVIGIVVVLAIPIRSVHWNGGTDARLLPSGTPSRVVSEQIATQFAGGDAEPIEALIQHASPAQAATLTGQIRRLPGVTSAQVTERRAGSDLVQVGYSGQPSGNMAGAIVRDMRDLPQPDGVTVLVGGAPADDADLLSNLASLLPWMVGIMAVAPLLLLFIAFGSVLLPLTAVIMNAASILAAFGVLVWIFQDGHLAGLLGFTATGSLQPNIPILILAVLFGLSTDYEVFLLSRIRESWDTGSDNDSSVALGLQRTGRIITSAALLLIVVVAGFTTGKIVFTKMIGVGMIVALVVDAALVRMVLVPAVMRLLGRMNWWVPAPLRGVHRRYGTADADGAAATPGSAAMAAAESGRPRGNTRE